MVADRRTGSWDGSTRAALLGVLIVGATLLFLKPGGAGLRLKGDVLAIPDASAERTDWSAAARRIHALLERDPPAEDRLPVIYIEPPQELFGVVIWLHVRGCGREADC